MEIPKGHQAVMPYLMVEGAARFIHFTQQVFQAVLTYATNRDESELLKHAEITINGSVIMFCDATEQWKPQTANFFVYVEDADHTYKTALDNGAESVMELSDQSYGRTCGVRDPVGNVWWVTSIQQA